mmetsp:Transcript_26959/g.62955  ORF Transcript_26959/g.62955 Transcript_26959/m.62955 type:complete len:367 (+) Transcript_26959:373-1473(+)
MHVVGMARFGVCGHLPARRRERVSARWRCHRRRRLRRLGGGLRGSVCRSLDGSDGGRDIVVAHRRRSRSRLGLRRGLCLLLLALLRLRLLHQLSRLHQLLLQHLQLLLLQQESLLLSVDSLCRLRLLRLRVIRLRRLRELREELLRVRDRLLHRRLDRRRRDLSRGRCRSRRLCWLLRLLRLLRRHPHLLRRLRLGMLRYRELLLLRGDELLLLHELRLLRAVLLEHLLQLRLLQQVLLRELCLVVGELLLLVRSKLCRCFGLLLFLLFPFLLGRLGCGLQPACSLALLPVEHRRVLALDVHLARELDRDLLPLRRLGGGVAGRIGGRRLFLRGGLAPIVVAATRAAGAASALSARARARTAAITR